MNLLHKLLWKGKNGLLIMGAAVGALIGLLILLNALQFYMDLNRLLYGDGSDNEHFIQINKKINIFNTLGASSTFSQEEIDNIQGLDFVQSVGAFTPNRYKVSATLEMVGFSTELFFEAVPDEFLDVDEPRFRWKKGQKKLPVILSRDYLALYNFGFAPAQGLPQFTPSTVQKAVLAVHVKGNGLYEYYQGQIVGFSDRINSILVPQDFMDYTNKTFGKSKKKEGVSRLILKVDNLLSDEVSQFLKDNNYEVSAGRLIGSQFTVLLNLMITVIASIGFIIFLLSAFIFFLNFQLIIARASDDIRLLLQIGYKPRQISQVLIRNLSILFGVILLLTFTILFLLRMFVLNQFEAQGFDLGSGLHVYVIAAAIVFTSVFLAVNVLAIRKSVRKLFG